MLYPLLNLTYIPVQLTIYLLGKKTTLKRILKQISRSCNDSMSISLVPILGQYSLDIHIITHNPKLTRMLF